MPRVAIDACQACGGPIYRNSRFVVVCYVDGRSRSQKARGRAIIEPATDRFHARCSGAFRGGWGA